MNKFLWLALGVFLGASLGTVVGVIVIRVTLPWEDICATLGPAQQLATTGSALIAELRSWLDTAERFLEAGASDQAVGEARSGLRGLMDRAGEIADDVRENLIETIAAPLRALIALAQVALGAVQEAVDGANNLIASIDQARCN